MYICLCNPFSDKDLKNFLKKKEGKSCVSEAYQGCSGGKKPQCCTCLKTVKEMVHSHANAYAEKELLEA